jgi:ferric-dicitrate binding protein FerR (iron transport regulator)
MEILRRSIFKLFKGTASKEEALDIMHVADEQLDNYFNEKEWESFTPGIVPDEWSVEWHNNIQRQIAPPRQLHWKRWVAAACFVLVATTGGLYFYTVQKPIAEIKATAQNRIESSKEKRIFNSLAKAQQYLLPDSSVVELSPSSCVTYKEPLEKDKRSFFLEGEGVFHVKKDARRAFTVYSSGIATTALGTVFKVSNFKDLKISVLLISGKIKVTEERSNKTLYLNPGQKCCFDPQSYTLEMSKTPLKKIAPATITNDDSPLGLITNNEIIFNKTPLREVFRQIDSMYKVHILFTGTPAWTRTFTGSFTKSDAPDEAMETISRLNDFELTRAGDTIYLRKK